MGPVHRTAFVSPDDLDGCSNRYRFAALWTRSGSVGFAPAKVVAALEAQVPLPAVPVPTHKDQSGRGIRTTCPEALVFVVAQEERHLGDEENEPETDEQEIDDAAIRQYGSLC